MALSQAALEKFLPSIYQSENGREGAESTSIKTWMLAVPQKPQQQQICDFEPGTDSDDPDNVPKPIAVKHPLGVNGNPDHHSQSTHQSLEVQPPATVVPSADFFDDHYQPIRFGDPPAPYVPPQMDVSPWIAQTQWTPVPTPYPARLVMDPSQAAAETAEPPQVEDPIQEAENPSQMLPQPVGEPSGPSNAQGFLGAALNQNPMGGEFWVEPPGRFEQAVADIETSNFYEASYQPWGTNFMISGSPRRSRSPSLPIDPALTAAPLAAAPTTSLPIDPALTAAPQLSAPAPTVADDG